MQVLRILALVATTAWMLPAAHAGRACEERAPDAVVTQRALQLAHETFERLTKSGAQVALIARAGQDLSRYGVRYSHLGFVWRDHPKGAWRVIQVNGDGAAREFERAAKQCPVDSIEAAEARVELARLGSR